jgi:hypothetical protein
MLKERDLRPGLSERFSGDRQRRALEGDRSLSEGCGFEAGNEMYTAALVINRLAR